MHDLGAQPVVQGQIERLLVSIERATPDPRAGLFGPASASWTINRESALFLGAGRAALLQLAHPWVATALQQHSTLMERPIERFHSTFRVVFTMIFGSIPQATAAARHLYELHTHIQGEVPDDIARYPRGSHYQANEVSALRWVYATLIESAVLAYETVLPPLAPDVLNTYYAESVRLAGLFGLPPSSLPPDWPSFLTYCRDMEQSNELGISDSARAMAHNLLRGSGSSVKPPHWYRALTTAWLPQRFRTEFHLPFGAEEERAVTTARKYLPRFYRLLPAALRFVGPWHEAHSRLTNHSAGPLTRLGNRFWIGRPTMPFS